MLERSFKTCPRCGAALKSTPSFAGPPCPTWLECSACNTYVNTYIPQPHQAALHRDAHTFIGNFGGYGTGKTLTSRQEVIKHLLLTPNANVLIGANVNSQYEQTIQRELEADIPAYFVSDSSQMKKYIDFKNGARLMYRPFDDPDKLRSYNLSMFVIVEASETSGETFHQLKTRTRNLAASATRDGQTFDWRKGIIESNPDAGWIRTDVLLVSDNIQMHGNVHDRYSILDSVKDSAIASHVADTSVNKYLPSTFVRDISRNKPSWWVARYVHSSFAYSEGLVYPMAGTRSIPAFEIPADWPRIIAYDYGLVDDSVFVFGAIDTVKGHLHIYKEVRTNDKDVSQLAQMFKDATADIPLGGMLAPPLIDPKSGLRRDYSRKSLIDHFLEYGVAFRPAYVNVDARIMRLNTYISSGRVSIHDCCEKLLAELRDYKFPARTLDGPSSDKPEDKNNHGINALEWIVMDLPANPSNILQGIYDRNGNNVLKPLPAARSLALPWNLSDEPEANVQGDLYNYFR